MTRLVCCGSISFMNEQFENLVEDLKNRTEKIGLYLVDASAATSSDEVREQGSVDGMDIAKMMANDEASFALYATFTVNKLAWSERIQNPDAFDEDKQFKMIMPTEEELLVERYKQAFIESGGDISSAFDLDDEGDI